MYNVTLWCFRGTIVAMETKQCLLFVLLMKVGRRQQCNKY